MMTEQQQNRIAELFVKHVQGSLSECEIKELKEILAKNKASNKAFATVTDPEKLLQLVMAKYHATATDYDAIKERMLQRIKAMEQNKGETE